MKRYLIIKSFSFLEEIVSTDSIDRKHLVELKDGHCEAIIDTQNNTYFDPKKNEWIKIKEIE